MVNYNCQVSFFAGKKGKKLQMILYRWILIRLISVTNTLETFNHTHTHTYIYIYIYMNQTIIIPVNESHSAENQWVICMTSTLDQNAIFFTFQLRLQCCICFSFFSCILKIMKLKFWEYNPRVVPLHFTKYWFSVVSYLFKEVFKYMIE